MEKFKIGDKIQMIKYGRNRMPIGTEYTVESINYRGWMRVSSALGTQHWPCNQNNFNLVGE